MTLRGQDLRNRRSAEAIGLRADGLLYKEIAKRMGLSLSYTQALVRDPSGDEDRRRKSRYDRPCSSCGRTINRNGLRVGTGLCASCLSDDQQSKAKKRLISEMHRFEEEFGRQPKATDWNPGLAIASGLKPTPGIWPPVSSVQYTFGSWNAGIEAAGFEPSLRLSQQGPKGVSKQELDRSEQLYLEHGSHKAARLLGISSSGLLQRLKRHNRGGLMASPTRPITTIEREIERVTNRVKSLEEQIRKAREDLTQLEEARRVLTNGKV